jgi:DNA repair exonuclease SbcCD ATPase subunit
MSFELKYNPDGSAIKNKELGKTIQEEQQNVSAAPETSNLQDSSGVVDAPQYTQPEEQSEQEAISSEPAASEEVYKQAEEQAQERQQKHAQESFKELREKAKQLERERDEYMRKLQEAQSDKDTEDLSIGDSDLAEGKHLKKLQAEVKRLRQESEANKQQSSLTQTEIRIKSQYTDFDRVVSPDNIAQLRESYPELAASINANADLYSKAVSAYTMIKKLGIHQDPVYNSEKARIAQNASKPKPSATIAPQKSDSPLQQANAFSQGLTPALRDQLRAEMEASRKGY